MHHHSQSQHQATSTSTPATLSIEDIEQLASDGSRFRVNSYRGVAFYYAGQHTELKLYESDDLDFEAYEVVPTGMVKMVMVGDDREHIIDPEDIQPLSDDEYCNVCGQIGCSHGTN